MAGQYDGWAAAPPGARLVGSRPRGKPYALCGAIGLVAFGALRAAPPTLTAREGVLQQASLRQEAVAGGAVTAVAWDGVIAYAGVGTRVVALTALAPAQRAMDARQCDVCGARGGGGGRGTDIGPHAIGLRARSVMTTPAAVVAWSAPLPDIVESITAASGTVAVRTAAASGGDIRILTRNVARLVPAGLIPGALLDAPFHGMSLDPDATKIYVVAAGVLEARNLASGDPLPGLRLEGVRGRPAAGRGFVLVGDAQGGLLVVGDDGAGLHRAGYAPGPDLEEVLWVAPDRALALARGEAPGAQVIAYDLAVPAAPTEIGRLPLATGAAFGARASRAVAAWSGSGRIQAFEGNGPVPLPRGVVTAHVPLAAVVTGETAVVGAGEGLFGLLMTDAERPQLVAGPFVGAGIANAVVWSGDIAAVAHGAGLTTYATSDGDLVAQGAAGRPGLAGGLTTDLLHGGRDIAWGRAGAVYVAAGETGLLAYDVSTPRSPVLGSRVSATELGASALWVAAAENAVYVGGVDSLWWFDAASPLTPRLRGTVPVEAAVDSVATSADRLLVAAGGRLFVADLVDGAPGPLRRLVEVELAEAVSAHGTMATVVSGAKLLVLDLMASPEPAVVGQVALPEPALTVALSETTAWVATPGFVLAVDVGGPQPRIAAQMPVRAGSARALAPSPNGVLVAGGLRGVRRLALVPGTPPTPDPTNSILLPRVLSERPAQRR